MKVTNTIDFEIKDKPYAMPNTWEGLSTDQLTHLSGVLKRYASGELSMSDVRLEYVCHFLGVDLNKRISPAHSDAIAANLYILLRLVTFIFDIKYEKGALDNISKETRTLALKTEPIDMEDSPEVRFLRKKDYQFVVSAIFAKQLVPEITVNNVIYKGYDINCKMDVLSCSLTASQYIDASEVLSSLVDKPERLPLLAAILYCPDTYSSAWSHAHASDFSRVDMNILESIALNFQAFSLYLFKRTHFNILWRGGQGKASEISLGMSDILLNLSQDGLGDINTIRQINVIDYLSIMRKKLVESVHSMHAAKMDFVDIAKATGLDIAVVQKIIN